MKELIRAIGGLLTIIVLLSLVIVDVVVDGASLSFQQLQMLVFLVGALLGLDIALDRIPLEMDVELSKKNRRKDDDSDE